MGSCSQVWNYCRWKYAGNSVLEVHIKRHTQMWSWSNIKRHRHLLKSYKNVYKSKLTQSKLSEGSQRQIQVCVLSLWRQYVVVPVNSLNVHDSNQDWWFYKNMRVLWKYHFNLKFSLTCCGKKGNTREVPFE